MSAYTLVDYAILAIFFTSVMTGLMHGLLKEILSLLSWIVAAFVASSFASTLANNFSGSAQSALQSLAGSSSSIGSAASQSVSTLTLAASFVGLFFGTLVLCSIVVYIINSAMMATGVSIFNRMLGAVFGLGRGYIITVIAVFVVGLTPLVNQAAWTNSQLEGIFEPAAQWLDNMVSPSIQALKGQAEKAVQGISTQMQNVGSTITNMGN